MNLLKLMELDDCKIDAATPTVYNSLLSQGKFFML